MTMEWDSLYEKKPLSQDMALFAVAMALHIPLLFLHMEAPPKHGRSRLVDIDYVEHKIIERKDKPAALPPKPITVKKITEMLRKPTPLPKPRLVSPPPPVVPPKIKIPDEIMRAPAAKPPEAGQKTNFEAQRKILMGKEGFKSRELNLASPNAPQRINTAAGPAVLRAGGSPGVGGPIAGGLRGKSGFQVSKAALPTGIGGGDIQSAGAPAVIVPVGKTARVDGNVLSPAVSGLRDKGPLKTGGISAAGISTSAGLSGLSNAGAPGAINIHKEFSGGAAAPSVIKSDRNFSGSVVAGKSAFVSAAPGLSSPSRSPASRRPAFVITGPLEFRKVVRREIPEYPAWAREKGIEASVTLKFTVDADGNVKENILIVRTTGYPGLDQLAADALKNWKFVPLPPDQNRDEVGAMTMNFTIR